MLSLQGKMARGQLVTKGVDGDGLELGVSEELLGDEVEKEEDARVVKLPNSLA